MTCPISYGLATSHLSCKSTRRTSKALYAPRFLVPSCALFSFRSKKPRCDFRLPVLQKHLLTSYMFLSGRCRPGSRRNRQTVKVPRTYICLCRRCASLFPRLHSRWISAWALRWRVEVWALGRYSTAHRCMARHAAHRAPPHNAAAYARARA